MINKLLRTAIYNIFGLRIYLTWVSKTYLWLVKNGFFKKKHAELFFLDKIIKPGFICIDIGANLGYYSVKLSNLCGINGKVLAVEPVPLFADVWKKNTKRLPNKNLQLYNYALGGENKKVKMGMPQVNGVLHHGMTRIASENQRFAKYFEVEMKIPDELFSNIQRIDFVKCDVEGYEYFVFSNMQTVLNKYKPIVQSELSGAENRKKVIDLFISLNYNVKFLENGTLQEYNPEYIDKYQRDFYFTPKED